MCPYHQTVLIDAIMNPTINPDERAEIISKVRKEDKSGHNCDDRIMPPLPDRFYKLGDR